MTELTDNEVMTFGCRLNTYESQVIKSLIVQAKLERTLVVNTCAVTAEAERQARQAIRKFKRENPDTTIIVTGCAAHLRPEQFQHMPEVSRVINNDGKMLLGHYLPSPLTTTEETAVPLVTGFEHRVRAYVQIQNGCDNYCTFCVVPYTRGPSRSIPFGVIVEQIRLLLDNGYQEVVLTGVDITAYGKDLPGTPSLGQIVKRLFLLLPDLPRLRLTSLDPAAVDEDLWDAIATEPRLMPHLHLSLQAGDDMILKRMKRRHSREDEIAFCNRARTLRPDIVFGADLIAGFPTETDTMAENTRNLVTACDISYLHVFPYSQRPNTPASLMPQVPKDVIKERAQSLRKVGEMNFLKLLQRFQGQEVNVLTESSDDQGLKGKTDQFTPFIITAPSPSLQVGTVFKARTTGYSENALIGEAL